MRQTTGSLLPFGPIHAYCPDEEGAGLDNASRPRSGWAIGRKPPDARGSRSADQAAFIFSIASETRLDSGWAASLASFSIASVFFDAAATDLSKYLRIIALCS